jgi:hypothetical protein
MILFFATWIAHGIAERQAYTDEQNWRLPETPLQM